MLMATLRRASLDSQFHLLIMGCRDGVGFWVYLSSLIVALFHLVYKKIFLRYEVDENPPCNLSEAAKSSEIFSSNPENSAGESDAVETEESDAVETEESEPDMVDAVSDVSDEVEPPPQQLFFSFKFPTFDEFARTQKDVGDSEIVSAQKLVEEEEASTCRVEELDADSKKISFDFTESNHSEILDFVEEADLIDEQNPEKIKLDEELDQELQQMDEEPKSDFSAEQKKFDLFWGSDSDSMTSSPGFSVMSRLLDSTSDDEEEFEKAKEFQEEEFEKAKEFEEEEFEKVKEFDEEQLEKSQKNGTENEGSQLDDQWEHQDLIEQLKMELKRVKAIGLPTIDENSESPKVIDDLKPWKIDEKSDRGAFISEIHQVHKSYKERMRKFDILNYQKMYALGLLKTKDPIPTQNQSSSSSLSSILPSKLCLCNKKKPKLDDPISKLIGELHGDIETVYVGQLCLSWEFLHWQYEKALDLWESDRFLVRCYNQVAGEFQQLQVLMQRFLENEEFEGPRVEYYVKSRCFLRNLLQVPVIREDNVKGKRKGRVKGEFGVTSDVLVEIIEESIRLFWRFVRADKDASGSGRKGFHPELEDSADSDMFIGVQMDLQKKEKKLKELMKGGNCILKKFKKHHHQEEEEEDGDGNTCYSSSSADQVVAFFCQVDMKLVRRVLNMSKLSTDHLIWCSGKLSKINFVQRRIHAEPSFLLFPC